jgi:hypothetical protein
MLLANAGWSLRSQVQEAAQQRARTPGRAGPGSQEQQEQERSSQGQVRGQQLIRRLADGR